jgi:hypothetical protein
MTVLVDHDYPQAGALKAVDAEDEPIEDVEIRIFTQVQYSINDRSTWTAETRTDLNGEWVDSVYLPDGQTWVVHFQKLSEFGPMTVEITT